MITVVGREPDGRFITTPEQCYPTLLDAMESTEGSSTSSTASFAVGVHYDGFNGTGSSLTVNGDACNGWLNLSSSWVNRISSTWNGCPVVSHFNGYNLSGSWEETYGTGTLHNLTSLNNLANSIAYSS